MRKGRSALSPFLRSCHANVPKRTAVRRKRARIRALPHPYFEPPHCRPSSRQMIEGTKKAAPRRSSWRILSLKGRRAWRLICGSWKNNSITKKDKPPIGKLIKKHHRQDAESVKTPPSTGEAAEATPSTAAASPVTNGRRERGKLCATILPDVRMDQL